MRASLEQWVSKRLESSFKLQVQASRVPRDLGSPASGGPWEALNCRVFFLFSLIPSRPLARWRQLRELSET
jgi:hypothetical protein